MDFASKFFGEVSPIMDNITQPVSFADSTETFNEADMRGSFGDGLDQQKSIVKQREEELKEMQEQIELYNQMVKQLASQREMAVKKLADMDTKIEELTRILETERLQVDAKDRELKTKRTQLQTLKNEETALKDKFNACKQELDSTVENLSNTQLQDTQVNTRLAELQQFLSMTNAAIDDIEKAISIKDTIRLSALCNQTLTPPPLSTNSLLTNGMKSTSATSPLAGQAFDQLKNAAANNDNTDSMFESSAANFDPFADDDPFDGDDPFKGEDLNPVLPEDDPFNPTSSSASAGFNLAHNDPFAPNASSRGGGF